LKAAVLEEINHSLALKDVETTSLRVGQVLVKVIVSGICGSQLHEINGNKGNSKFLPHLMGHEGCGIVQEVGAGVTSVKPGDKVVMHWRPGLGIESEFPTYSLNGRSFTSGKVNTLCELAIVSENRVTRVPAETNSEFAALLGCSLSTSLALIENESNLKFGESVVVIGCGGLGLSLIAAAKLRGAGEIIAIEQVESKRNLAITHGATDFHTSVIDLVGTFDLVVDTTGNSENIRHAFGILSGVGRMLLVGQPNPGQSISLPNAIQLFNGFGQSIRATQGGGMIPQRDIPRYLKLFELGLISIDSLITHRFNLNQVNLAFDTLKSGIAGRIIIRIGEMLT
jgi:S-(hydroxymethyl)glutathione dehydrogenase/alcohol dehydrogenase